MKIKSFLIILILISANLPLFAIQESKNSTEDKDSLLILFSYNPDYLWTRQIYDGMMETLETENLNISIEYMDFRNHTGQEYRSSYLDTFRKKYGDRSFDYLVTADNLAHEFYMTNMIECLADAKVICTGLNGDGWIPDRKDQYYIVERSSYRETIELAIKQNPEKGSIMLIGDKTETSNYIQKQIEDELSYYDLKLIIPDNSSYLNIVDAVKQLDEDTIVFYIMFFQDDQNTFKYDEIINLITEKSRQPFYVVWDFFIDEGALGGYCYSGHELGKYTAEQLNRLRDGIRIQSVQNPIMNQYIFDYSIIRKYGMDSASFPKESVFINKPLTFYERHETVILILGSIIAVLITIILLIMLNLKKKSLLNEKSRLILGLQDQQLKHQKTLLLKLGDVIETRSKETGNHVLRVAKIAEYIGRKAGLPKDLIARLEAAAPLHDIGKVAIPDTILNKPGKLTPEEFDEMKTHTTLGYEVLDDEDDLIHSAALIALQHHERWDGKGYPGSLSKENIDILSRIASVADVLDALRCKRIYKKAWSREETRDYIREQSGLMFDPLLARIVVDNYDEIEKIRKEFSERD